MDAVRHSWEGTSVDEDPITSCVGRSIVNWLPQTLETLELVQRDDLTVSLKNMLAGVEIGTRRLPRLQSIMTT
ncbi:MAG: hypothetical protein Q9215_007548, partial [Flavoplaca cf. flavocitrina]